MKRITLLLSVLLIATSVAFAQNEKESRKDRKNSPRKERRIDRGNFIDRLNLTDDQKEKLKQIDADFDKERSAVEKSRISPDMQQKKLAELREKRKNDFTNLLTDEQKKILGEKRPRFEGNKPPMMPPQDCPMAKEDSCCATTPKMAPQKGQGRPQGFANHRQWGGKRTMGHHPHSMRMLKGVDLNDKQKEEIKKIAEEHKAAMDEMSKKHRNERTQLAEKQKEAIQKILTDEQKQKVAENMKDAELRRPKPENQGIINKKN